MWSLLIGLLNISSVTIISPSIRSNESSDDGLSNTTITIIACAVGGGVVLLIVLLERKRRKLVMGENQHAEGLGEKDYIYLRIWVTNKWMKKQAQNCQCYEVIVVIKNEVIMRAMPTLILLCTEIN